ncbi:MAG: UvrD-helicase domain-containing protein [Anaerolineae bacterium]|jgi:DNA helicase II / ATP-dependent DNA helicase PcrA|nr:UvrD-helicase domain-containing protein [Anaerolineae bacterium]MBT7069375.1 UvrD-helicase domain-containing protein [Anaerolineae bacterium]MBT7326837.1 UvrD-helicase domain-containing protein [Anaerolineae bacterium]
MLDSLNPQQKEAVTAGTGPVLVLAGPGSGKTRVLTQRIAYLIGQQSVRAYQILAVTFTNKAAREMKERVENLIGPQFAQGLMLGTFHSVCARILRREVDQLPYDSNFVIFDSDDQQNVVKTALRELNIDEKRYRPRSVHGSISNAKNELIKPEQYPTTTYRDEVVKRVYARYQELLIENNALDFDDLLMVTARLLEEEPAIREKYAERFQHILVDEFQDTNMAQYTLLKHLASFHKNIFVVGDPDQSIYRWRGADYRNVNRFEQDNPNTVTILLEQNYRSKQNILDAAMAVIDKNSHRKRKELFTERGEGNKLSYFEAADDYAEASFIVDTIAQITSNGIEPRECAVMYRTNAQSRLLEEAFLRANMPYRLVGAQRFYGRREVKDIIAYLRLIHNPSDQVSLGRVIGTPPRGIGKKTLETLHTVARAAGNSPGAALLDLSRGSNSPYWESFTPRAAASLSNFGSLFADWRASSQILTISELFDKVVSDIGYSEYLNDGSEEGEDRWDNIVELRRLAEEYDERTLTEFLENVALISDQDTLSEGKNAPTLLTLHAAKGLEYGVVFIVGLDDGLLPHNRTFDDPEEMAEERRLFYVGITRAKNQLYLVRSVQRGGRGYPEATYPSRFLDDIPEDLLLGRSRAGGRASRGSSRSQAMWSTSSYTGRTDEKPAPVISTKYKMGTRIRHAQFGEGIVLNSKLEDGDETVTIVFESVGIKRLAASLAKLEILE